MSFPVGSRVRIRSEEWLVRGVRPLRQPGHYALQVVGLSETVRDYEATFLTSIDKPTLIDPAAVRFVQDDSPEYRRSRLFLHALMSRTPWVGEQITIRGQVAMEDNEYQFVPAQKALSQPRPRILIADGVGLGKTIEAGILMAELIRRGRGTRILVVTTRAMLEQVQKELWTRFSIPLMRLDSYGIERIRREIPVNKNPFYHYDRVILSMDTLKSDRYRSFIEQCRWDIVWIDECHNVANAGTDRNRLAEKLAQTTHALILTSATPHNGNPESFATLIRMLDPTAAPDAKKLTREDIDHLVVRRFKTDVMQQAVFPKVHDETVLCPASGREVELLRQIRNLMLHVVHGKRGHEDKLFVTTLLKSFLSSPEALVQTASARLHTLEKRRVRGEPVDESDIAQLTALVQAAEVLPLEETAKFQALVRTLREWGWDGSERSPRVVLFSERHETLRRLQDALREEFGVAEEVVPVFTARLSDTEQEDLVRQFNEAHSPIRLLLASDVMSEGVNLHHRCHHLIHFDIPWSFIRLQQRNGRIDRFGQTESPEIRYLVLTTDAEDVRAETRVIEKITEKMHAIQHTLGDPTAVLHLYTAEAEEEAIGNRMAETDEDQPFSFDFDAWLEQAAQWAQWPLTGTANQENNAAPGAAASVAQSGGGNALPSSATDAVAVMLPRHTGTVPVAEARAWGWYDDWLRVAEDLSAELTEQARRFRQQYGFDDPDRRREEIRVYPAESRVVIRGVEELQYRLRNLPPEARQAEEMRLTTDPRRVLRAIQTATDEGGWLKEHLLWDVHPVAEWMLDRALSLFGPEEAPAIYLPFLPENRRYYLIQMVSVTRSGHPALAEWYVAEVDKDQGSVNVRLWQGSGDPLLAQPWVNPQPDPEVGRDLDVGMVLAAAEKVAHERLARARRDLEARISAARARVKASLEQALAATQLRLDVDDGMAAARQARAAQQREKLRQKYQAVLDDLDRMLEFEPPVLRVCARLERG